MPACPDFHYTPDEIANNLLKDIKFFKGDTILEPCKGRGVQGFYKHLTEAGHDVDWCEIDEGVDFFEYSPPYKYSKVITNPPYKDNAETENIAWRFMLHCFDLSLDECWFLLNHQMMNGLTPIRLKQLAKINFGMTHLRVLNIKQWYGRYYWVCFKKGGKSIIHFQ